MTRRVPTVLAVMIALVPVGGCGLGGDSDARPKCAEVWVVGKMLPKSYEGCTHDGDFVEYDPYDCPVGQLYTYDDRYWVVDSGPIKGGDGDLFEELSDFSDAFMDCFSK